MVTVGMTPGVGQSHRGVRVDMTMHAGRMQVGQTSPSTVIVWQPVTLVGAGDGLVTSRLVSSCAMMAVASVRPVAARLMSEGILRLFSCD